MSGLTAVVIEDGLISEKTTGAIVIDGKGGFLMPGLIDAHAHPGTVKDLELSAERGVSSTFALSAPNEIKNQPGLTRIWSSHAYALGNVEDAQAFVANEAANGADYVKVIIEDPARMAPRTISREVLEGIVAAARRSGLRVAAHAVTVPTFRMAVQAGVDIIIHVPLEAVVPQSIVDNMARQGTAVVPTLVMMEAFANSPVHGYRSEDYKNAEDNVRMFLAAGVPVLAGSDSSTTPYVPKIHHGTGLHRELRLLVHAGMTPLEALKAATSVPAEIFGFTSVGALRPGRRADLILIDGHPDKDIEDTLNIKKVWFGGKEYN
ncbi:MAG: amidohydrolase family protein [Spirochaetaceae bacterium]|nr:amidohydrolase family protein [Spirochaetaceae bacterium]